MCINQYGAPTNSSECAAANGAFTDLARVSCQERCNIAGEAYRTGVYLGQLINRFGDRLGFASILHRLGHADAAASLATSAQQAALLQQRMARLRDSGNC